MEYKNVLCREIKKPTSHTAPFKEIAGSGSSYIALPLDPSPSVLLVVSLE